MRRVYSSSSSSLVKATSIALAIFFVVVANVETVRSSPHHPKTSHHKKVIDGSLLTEKIVTNRTIVVDVNGGGDFKSIQAAIDSIPVRNSNWVIVQVQKGIYREKVHIPRSKPFVFLRGSGKSRTYIASSQSSINNIESATFKVEASNFIAFGISFKNDAPTGEAYTSQNQSVAAYVAADKVAFYHCGFFSTHNTLFDLKGRHYYDACYIQGSIDFIFGRARSIFHDCEIFVLVDRRIKIHGSITAHNRENPNEPSGLVFNQCKVYGTDQVYLGRAKGPYSRVLFANSYLSGTITPEGWSNWSYDGPTDNFYLAEYNNQGPGASRMERVSWGIKASDEEATRLLSIDFIDGKQWLPAWF